MSNELIENHLTDILPSIRQYPSSIQVGVLKYYLLYLFKNSSKKEFVNECEILRSSLNAVSGHKDNDKDAVESIALHLGVETAVSETDREKLSHINNMLNELKLSLLSTVSLKSIASLKPSDEISISDLLLLLVDNENSTKLALNEAAKEMFDRVLTSLDPAKAESFLDQGIKRKGAEHKAALYDAMCEKYEQLFDYHENGRLVKDFRRLYRGKLKGKPL